MLADCTIKEMDKKMRYLAGVLEELKAQGKLSTTDPRCIRREDIQAFLQWMRDRELDRATQAKYLRYVGKVCSYLGNPVVVQLKEEEGKLLPRGAEKELKALSEIKLSGILKTAGTIKGWHGDMADFMLWVYAYTGLRPKELRLAHMEDLNVEDWTIHVRHPKCEEGYGIKRTVPILPPARPAVYRYLKARAAHLEAKNRADIVALLPNTRSSDGFYTDKALRAVKQKVQKASGIEFKLKDLRPTWAQMNLDRGVNLSVVSKFMGHATTQTTEKYYARLRDKNAYEQIEEAWPNADVPPESKRPFNEHVDQLPGYG